MSKKWIKASEYDGYSKVHDTRGEGEHEYDGWGEHHQHGGGGGPIWNGVIIAIFAATIFMMLAGFNENIASGFNASNYGGYQHQPQPLYPQPQYRHYRQQPIHQSGGGVHYQPGAFQ